MKQSYIQFVRIKRWRDRLEDAEFEQKMNEDPKYYEDILFTLFENCWHLKDWLIRSKELDEKIVKGFFHNNSYMKICQSLAIGSKHLIPTNPLVKKTRIFSPNQANNINKQSFNILTEDGIVVDAFELAKKCIRECGDFLVKQKVVR